MDTSDSFSTSRRVSANQNGRIQYSRQGWQRIYDGRFMFSPLHAMVKPTLHLTCAAVAIMAGYAFARRDELLEIGRKPGLSGLPQGVNMSVIRWVTGVHDVFSCSR